MLKNTAKTTGRAATACLIPGGHRRSTAPPSIRAALPGAKSQSCQAMRSVPMQPDLGVPVALFRACDLFRLSAAGAAFAVASSIGHASSVLVAPSTEPARFVDSTYTACRHCAKSLHRPTPGETRRSTDRYLAMDVSSASRIAKLSIYDNVVTT